MLISKEAKDNLIESIAKRFFLNSDCDLSFTGSKTSEIYRLLQIDIKKIAKVLVGVGSLRDIMTFKHNGNFQDAIYNALIMYISPTTYKPRLEKYDNLQKIFWGLNQGLPVGAFVNTRDGEFITWNVLEKELNERAIVQCPKFIPPDSYVVRSDFYGKKDWVLNIANKNGEIIGSVWVGGNPYDNWSQDGLVRVGRTISDEKWEVFQILGKFSDGSYKIIYSFV